ncbi:MAG: Smr/MutS family protein [bacterium]
MLPPDDEIDLHECYPGELRMKLLPFLDRGYSEGWEKVNIIHGVGEGVLKDRVWSMLEDLEYIDEFHHASIYDGGRGTTVAVYSKDDGPSGQETDE